jgi:hypothetical protein
VSSRSKALFQGEYRKADGQGEEEGSFRTDNRFVVVSEVSRQSSQVLPGTLDRMRQERPPLDRRPSEDAHDYFGSAYAYLYRSRRRQGIRELSACRWREVFDDEAAEQHREPSVHRVSQQLAIRSRLITVVSVTGAPMVQYFHPPT